MEIKAAVHEDITENITSEVVAEQYGLEIDPLNIDEEDIWVEFGNDWTGIYLGRVTMKWYPEVSSSRGFPVRCLVFEECIQGLFLGTNFLENRDAYTRLWLAES